ncbi:MAG: endonuclease/exonuclease/phosphatase family protein [Acidimicrobiia bacterium]|nr:endonuclease/exonuclease/phosphatase family protein [Acidimicrobiia bacterium]
MAREGIEDVHVVTWNIRHGDDLDRAIAALRRQADLAAADVILLQEMDEPGTIEVADALGYHHVYASPGRHAKTGRDFGNAILSSAPLADREVVELPHKALLAGHARIAIGATATFDGLDVRLWSTHTEIPSLAWPKRRDQFEVFAKALAGSGHDHVIGGGDFNTISRKGIRYLINHLEQHGLAHVSIEAVTLRRAGRNFTLDHLFARGLCPIDSGVVTKLDVSDHAPVWVRLELIGS